MEATVTRFGNAHIVFLYDPTSVSKIPVDPIKASTQFNLITLLPFENVEALILGNDPLKIKATFQSNRFEYVDENDVPYAKQNLSELDKLLNAIPPFSVRSIGINFITHMSVRHEEGVGKYFAQHYVKDALSLEERLKDPVLGSSIRLFMGTPEHYHDLRLTPLALSGKDFVFQYHLHQEIHVAESQKLLQILNDAYERSWHKVDFLLERLP